jgi:hypothetical protein
MKPALVAEVADLIEEVGKCFIRIATVMRADTPAQPEPHHVTFNDTDEAMARAVAFSFDDKTPEEIEILKRLRRRKPSRGDDK